MRFIALDDVPNRSLQVGGEAALVLADLADDHGTFW